MVRTLQLDLKNAADVDKALAFQIEPHLPFALEEAILQTQIERKEGGGFNVTVFALKESSLQEHLESCSLHHIEPDSVTSHALALAALMTLEKKQDSDEVQFFMNIGEKETTLLLVKEDKVIDQRSFLTEKQVGATLQRALLSLENANPSHHISTLFLFGKESEQQVKQIQELTRKKIHTMNPQIEALSKEDLATFAIALGAALSQTVSQKLNFRQKNLKKPFSYKFIKKPLLLFGSLALLSVGLLLGGGYYSLNAQKVYTQQKMAALLEFRGEIDPLFTTYTCPEECISLLSDLEQNITNEEQSYALEPILPQVSEILGWLAEEINKAPPPLKGVIIESFDYTLVNRPTPFMKAERYQIAITLTFSAYSPNVKEAFEEFLEKATFMINPHQPIEVSFGSGKGTAHFTLQDQTRYG